MLKLPLPSALLLGLSPLLYSLQSAAVEPVIVTANRTAQTADQTLSSVTVVTREDIERRQARSVQDALRGTPGLSISNSGGEGKATSFFLRGTESDHVLVLIDGIKVGSATLGATAFQDLPIDQIERIEVVRGPRSSLYGSEAIGGVIQIFTRKGGGPARPWFNAGAGTYDTRRGSAGVSGGGEHSWYNISGTYLSTDGFNSCRGEPGVAGCFTNEPDKDGYRNRSAAIHAGHRFDNGAELAGHWLRTEGDNRFDGGFQNESETLQQVLGATLKYSPNELWRLNLTAGRSWDESDNFHDGVFASRFDSKRDTVTLQNDFLLDADRIATVGVDYQNDRVDSSTDYALTERSNKGVFAQYQQYLGRHDIEASLRRDDNEQFGQHTTGSAAWGYAIGETMRVVVNYGTAFKAPTFNELYFPGFGNPALDPEESSTVELGLRGQPAWGAWSVAAFRTDVDNLIAFDASTFAPANIGSARITGLEGTASTQLGLWAVQSTLTLLDTENRSLGAQKGNTLPRRADRQLRIDVDRAFARYSLGATLFAEGDRYDDLANTRTLDGYATLDLRGEYRFAKHWRVQARLGNVFDRDYETASFYNQPGRTVFLTVRYQPGSPTGVIRTTTRPHTRTQ